jgi:hypothetical protein
MAAKLSEGKSTSDISAQMNCADGTRRLARAICTGEMSIPVTANFSASICPTGTPQPQPKSSTGAFSDKSGINSESQLA